MRNSISHFILQALHAPTLVAQHHRTDSAISSKIFGDAISKPSCTFPTLACRRANNTKRGPLSSLPHHPPSFARDGPFPIVGTILRNLSISTVLHPQSQYRVSATGNKLPQCIELPLPTPNFSNFRRIIPPSWQSETLFTSHQALNVVPSLQDGLEPSWLVYHVLLARALLGPGQTPPTNDFTLALGLALLKASTFDDNSDCEIVKSNFERGVPIPCVASSRQ